MASDPAEAREKRLARYRRYNTSRKGQARNQRYEDEHPERKSRERWNTMATNRGRGEE